LDSLCELTLSRGIGLAKKPALNTVLVLQVDKLCRDMPNKRWPNWIACTTGRSIRFLHHTSTQVRRLERNVAIHWRFHHHYLPARKRKLGKYTTMIGNIGSDNFIGRKLKTG
jgi:hypothetical protein